MATLLQFLKRFKAKVQETGLIPVQRSKVYDELRILCWMIEDLKNEIILKLSPENYHQGPMKDHDGSPGEIWEFGVRVGTITYYVKLKLDDEAKCLSFKMAEYEMYLPLEKKPKSND